MSSDTVATIIIVWLVLGSIAYLIASPLLIIAKKADDAADKAMEKE